MFDLTNKTILVAGGAGYLGSQLCEAILLHNGNICIADINVEKINLIKNYFDELLMDQILPYNFFLLSIYLSHHLQI